MGKKIYLVLNHFNQTNPRRQNLLGKSDQSNLPLDNT